MHKTQRSVFSAVWCFLLCAAAALRLAGLGAGEPDPFYDAAVRSMGTSWHALLVGAFEPGARVAGRQSGADPAVVISAFRELRRIRAELDATPVPPRGPAPTEPPQAAAA